MKKFGNEKTWDYSSKDRGKMSGKTDSHVGEKKIVYEKVQVQNIRKDNQWIKTAKDFEGTVHKDTSKEVGLGKQ